MEGSNQGRVPNVVGLTADAATERLQDNGFKVDQQSTTSAESSGTVVGTAPTGTAIPGSTVTIYVSNGQGQVSRPDPGPRLPPTTIQIPGIGPIVIPGG